jgi:hypothetical protein
MNQIIDLDSKRKERIYKLTPDKILQKYWNQSTLHVDIISISLNIKEFRFELVEFNTSLNTEFNNFFSTISNINSEYILHHKKDMSVESLRLCISFALSFIIDQTVDSDNNKCVLITEKMIRESNPKSAAELRASLFTEELLLPLNSVIKTINKLKDLKLESTVGNISRMLDVANIQIVVNRLKSLNYLI